MPEPVLVPLSDEPVDAEERDVTIADIDAMDGWSFEGYVAWLLRHKGYDTEVTKGSGDLGVDVIARREGEAVAVQCKRQVQSVSRRAVSDAVAGKAAFGCTAAMVVTNNYFTQGAKVLANANGCILVDREVLGSWVAEFQPPQEQPTVEDEVGLGGRILQVILAILFVYGAIQGGCLN